jgi:two-component system, NtrC family, sensor kinase
MDREPDRLRDLPAEKLLAALVDARKESVRGTLIKGIVHNLNGALQVLSMRMELLQRLLAQGKGDPLPAAREQVDQCLGQVDQFRGLVEGLMRKEIAEETEGPRLVRANDLFEECLGLLHHNLFFKHQVRVERNFSPALPPCRTNYADLSLGIWSLLQNAVEAMENSPEKTLTAGTETDGRGVRFLVRDTGGGIPEHLKPRIFEPFFTTKKGAHSGLGLFIARRVLEKCGAGLDFSSREGETVFRVYLPTSVGRGN